MVAKITNWIVSGTLIKAAIAVWMLFICGIILLAYHAYLPPDFSRGFLVGREQYFYGLYAVGFYAHIATAPPVLVIGMLQSSRTLRKRYVRLHQRLGQAYCLMILWAMAPGGLIMAFRAYSGWPATTAFVLLSMLTWWFTYRGWVSIGRWDVKEHGRWMQRSFIPGLFGGLTASHVRRSQPLAARSRNRLRRHRLAMLAARLVDV